VFQGTQVRDKRDSTILIITYITDLEQCVPVRRETVRTVPVETREYAPREPAAFFDGIEDKLGMSPAVDTREWSQHV
jgi:hypothetical protein